MEFQNMKKINPIGSSSTKSSTKLQAKLDLHHSSNEAHLAQWIILFLPSE